MLIFKIPLNPPFSKGEIPLSPLTLTLSPLGRGKGEGKRGVREDLFGIN
jgi:hypothetical protein